MSEKEKTYKLQEVFTPSQPAEATFIDRNKINKRLERALKTPGKQIIIYGFSGAGKTTLLFNKLKQENIGYIKTSCITGMTIQDIIIDAFNQLEIFYLDQKNLTETNTVGGELSASFLSIKAGIKAETKGDNKLNQKRAVELPITPQTLAKFIGEANFCWVIEDFHKIEESHKLQMAQIMKVFMDSSVQYPQLKIIALGAVNSAREVVHFDPEMRSRISEIEVPLMDVQNLKRIIEIGENLLNLYFSDTVKNRIATYSSGLPAVTHQLCLILCELNGISKTEGKKTKIQSDKFNEALEEYLEENSDTFKSVYEHCTRVIHKRKNENPVDLLTSILSTEKENFSILEIKGEIQKKDKHYIGTNLKKYIDEFTEPLRSEILRYNENSNSYFFSNPFIKAYIQCVIQKDDFITNKNVKSEKFLTDFKQILKQEFILARQAFIADFGNEDFGNFDDF
ncbi:ATP-binding protein [Flavobacterium psychrophilum]|uniref:ATP-binding protein n=1 Tax=Flavobacterium psychrophilum TaxID=96345 RepID=UPI00106B7650|nr:ATP-binding protein [Flavobacterium psychrophilum]ELY2018365.1 ATP-binding protein [Flavobacterium psychrophilum]MCB6089533.1 ATP-binding protein [Flavobacterium psychrophilum]